MLDHTQRAFALVGPGRAGTTLARAMAARGWTPIAVAGRAPDSASVVRVSESLDAPARDVGLVGAGAARVLLATPHTANAHTPRPRAPTRPAGALVLHLSGVCTVDELHKLRVARPDVELGSLHPLQSLPSPDIGVTRLPGSWCAVDGPPEVERLAISLGMRPFRVNDADRIGYHAAATVASNHLVALLAQAARLADTAGVPAAALLPLVHSTLENIETLGPGTALTGPVARGDVDTVRRHLDALPDDEKPASRALAEQARRLAGRDDPAMRHALEGDS